MPETNWRVWRYGGPYQGTEIHENKVPPVMRAERPHRADVLKTMPCADYGDNYLFERDHYAALMMNGKAPSYELYALYTSDGTDGGTMIEFFELAAEPEKHVPKPKGSK